MVHFVTAPVGAPNAHLELESQHKTLHTSSTHIDERFDNLQVFHMHVIWNLQIWLNFERRGGMSHTYSWYD